MNILVLVIVVGTSIWMLVDAKNIGVRKGLVSSKLFDMGPVGWFFAGLLIWIVAFPCYLVKRAAYKQAVVDIAAGKRTINEDVPLSKQMSPGKIVAIVIVLIIVIVGVAWAVMHASILE